MIYSDREEAGKRLAEALGYLRGEKNLLVLALPRGGVPVAYQVARFVESPLDLIIPRKIGAPYNPEFAIGAVAEPDVVLWNERLLDTFSIPSGYLEQEVEKQLQEIKRRKEKYGSENYSFQDKNVVIVDDGIATGFTMLAAIKSVKRQGAVEITVATPVAPPDTVRMLEKKVDKVVCLVQPKLFSAVGQFYYQFEQITDQEVMDLMQRAKQMEVG